MDARTLGYAAGRAIHARADLCRCERPNALPRPPIEGTFRLFLIVFIAVTVLQRFAVPVIGSELGIGFVICLVVVTSGLFTARFVFSVPRLALYAVATGAMLATLIAKTASFSFLSLFMLFTLYLPYVVIIELSPDEWLKVLGMFQKAMILCSFCGLAQFLAQLVFGPSGMFPFDQILPESLFIPQFNLRIPVGDGTTFLKSTGLWFLEPSVFAQFLGFAIAIELIYFRRPAVVAVFGTAYLATFSGSGIVLVAAVSGFSLIRRGRLMPLILLAVGAVVISLLHDVPPFSLFLERLGEFSSTQSSGSMRFLAPYWFVQDKIAVRPITLLFGDGPGQIGSLGWSLDYAVLDTSWLKLLAEYGLVGAVPFLAFYGYSLFHRTPDSLLSFACLFQFLFLGGYLNSFYVQFLHMALIIWPRVQNTRVESVCEKSA